MEIYGVVFYAVYIHRRQNLAGRSRSRSRRRRFSYTVYIRRSFRIYTGIYTVFIYGRNLPFWGPSSGFQEFEEIERQWCSIVHIAFYEREWGICFCCWGRCPCKCNCKCWWCKCWWGGAGQLFSRHAEESQQQGPLVGDTREGIAEDGGAEKEGQGCVLGRLWASDCREGQGVRCSKCWLECIKEGGACGQLLSIHNPHRSAQDHFKPSACKAAKQAQGQEMLAEKRDISQVEARPWQWRYHSGAR